MKLFVYDNHMEIIPETAQDIAYMEHVLNLYTKESLQSVTLKLKATYLTPTSQTGLLKIRIEREENKE